MNLESLISAAREQGASDLHLEAGLPAALRVRGTLRTLGEPITARVLMDWAREVIGAAHWNEFVEADARAVWLGQMNARLFAAWRNPDDRE